MRSNRPNLLGHSFAGAKPIALCVALLLSGCGGGGQSADGAAVTAPAATGGASSPGVKVPAPRQAPFSVITQE